MNKKILIVIILLFFLFAGSFLAMKFAGKKGRVPEISLQEGEISKLGLVGHANLLLSSPKTDVDVGGIIEVTASAQLTDDKLKVSGVDVVILYEKSKLEVIDVVPNIKSVFPDAPFDVAPIVTYGGKYDDTFDFLRVAEVASRSGSMLVGGTVNLAKITFRAKEKGIGVIKYPDDNKYLEIAGVGTYVSSTPSPTNVPTLNPTPIKTNTPIPTKTLTPIPTKTLTPIPTKTLTPTKSMTPTPTKTRTPTPSTIVTPQNLSIIPTKTVIPTSIPYTWTIRAQPICTNGITPSGSARVFYAQWPPNPLSWQYDNIASGTHIVKITGTGIGNVYLGMEYGGNQVALKPYPPAPHAAIEYGTFFNPPTYMARWQQNLLPSGTYTLKFEAPLAWCMPSFTPTPTKTMTPTPTKTKTPTPTKVVTVTPTATVSPIFCPQKAQGDANCDSLINETDYSIWKCEFTKSDCRMLCTGNSDTGPVVCTAISSSSKNADFNKDGVVDLKDFEIWRANATRNTLPTVTNTPIPTPTKTNTPTPTKPTIISTPTVTLVPGSGLTPAPTLPAGECIKDNNVAGQFYVHSVDSVQKRCCSGCVRNFPVQSYWICANRSETSSICRTNCTPVGQYINNITGCCSLCGNGGSGGLPPYQCCVPGEPNCYCGNP